MAEAYNFFPTADEIVISSFELLRVYDPTNPNSMPGITDNQRAYVALNFMLTAWQVYGLQLWARKTASFSLVENTLSYSVGSGGDIDINRPLKIYDAWRHDVNSGLDVPLELYGDKDYYSIPNKSQTGTPIALYYDPRYESNSVQEGATAKGLIYIWTPADSYNASNTTIYFRYQRPFNDFTLSSDTLDFPQEWNEAIKYNLALRLAPIYGIPVMEYDRLKSMAKELKDEVLGFDTEDTSLKIQPRLK